MAADMGILPWDFWRMTPAELAALWAAHQKRDEQAWERTAWMVHYLLSAWVKDAPSVDRLLGRVTDA